MLISYVFRFTDDEGETHFSNWVIVDSDFKEIVIHDPSHMPGSIQDIGPIIDIYEKRYLPVVPNIIRAIMCLNKDRGLGIDGIFNWNKEHNPKFAKYEKDIEKYLTII
jgi:hypothetical protein